MIQKNIKNQLERIDVEELLGKKNIKETKELSESIDRKVILITGGAGSIGSAIVRKVITYNPKKVIGVDFYENGIFELEREIREKEIKEKSKLYICDVKNICLLNEIFKENKPNIVIHAASYKNIPIMEYNKAETIRNNVLGTYNLIKMCEKYKVEKFLLISTDKAVNPTSIVGASKRICEMLVKAMKKSENTKYIAVRLGNVIETNGSLIKIIKEQIKEGKEITITDKKMNRYFISKEEAINLMLLSLNIAKNGEIYLLDMGEPVNIYNFIVKYLNRIGIERKSIKIIGKRPGEKLNEQLCYDTEKMEKTKYEKIYSINEEQKKNENEIIELIEKCKEIIEKDYSRINEVYNIVKILVPTYLEEKIDTCNWS